MRLWQIWSRSEVVGDRLGWSVHIFWDHILDPWSRFLLVYPIPDKVSLRSPLFSVSSRSHYWIWFHFCRICPSFAPGLEKETSDPWVQGQEVDDHVARTHDSFNRLFKGIYCAVNFSEPFMNPRKRCQRMFPGCEWDDIYFPLDKFRGCYKASEPG